MGDAAFDEIRIEPPPSRHAKTMLETARRIIEAGMDDFAIARGNARTDDAGGFGDQDGVTAPRHFRRARKANSAGADNEAVDVVNVRTGHDASSNGIRRAFASKFPP